MFIFSITIMSDKTNAAAAADNTNADDKVIDTTTADAGTATTPDMSKYIPKEDFDWIYWKYKSTKEELESYKAKEAELERKKLEDEWNYKGIIDQTIAERDDYKTKYETILNERDSVVGTVEQMFNTSYDQAVSWLDETKKADFDLLLWEWTVVEKMKKLPAVQRVFQSDNQKQPTKKSDNWGAISQDLWNKDISKMTEYERREYIAAQHAENQKNFI